MTIAKSECCDSNIQPDDKLKDVYVCCKCMMPCDWYEEDNEE